MEEQGEKPQLTEMGGGVGGGIGRILMKSLKERNGAFGFSFIENEGSETTADDDDEWD